MGSHEKLLWLFHPIVAFSGHPRWKTDVSYRLSRSGLAVAYGQSVEFQGPIVQNITYSTADPTINITYGAVSSMELRNPIGFEVMIFFYLRWNQFYTIFVDLLSRKHVFE